MCHDWPTKRWLTLRLLLLLLLLLLLMEDVPCSSNAAAINRLCEEEAINQLISGVLCSNLRAERIYGSPLFQSRHSNSKVYQFKVEQKLRRTRNKQDSILPGPR